MGSYRIIRKLAEDPVAEVFLAKVVGAGEPETPVTLERLLPEPARNTAFVESFLASARTFAALPHPHVVRVLDAGLDKGQPCRVLEFLDGEDLRSLLEVARERGWALGLRQVCFIVQRVAEGLACAHQARVGHRGLHPAQVRLSSGGEVKLVDPGGVFRSELHYLSPEQARGRPAEPRGDVFRLGLLLYELLARRPLFEASHPQVVQHIGSFDERDLEPLPGCPPSLWAVLLRAVAAAPEARFPSARAFADKLHDFLQERQLGVDHLDIAHLFARAFPERRSPLEELADMHGEHITLTEGLPPRPVAMPPILRTDPGLRVHALPPPVLHPVKPPPPREPTPGGARVARQEPLAPSWHDRLHAWHARLLDEALGLLGGSAALAPLLIRLTRCCVEHLGGGEEEKLLALTAARTLALAARLEEPRRFVLPSLTRIRSVVGGELPELNQILSAVLFAERDPGPPGRDAARALLCAVTFVVQVQSAEPGVAESARALAELRGNPRLVPAALEALAAELGVGSRAQEKVDRAPRTSLPSLQ